MNVLITILSTIVVINALLLIGLILIQQSKGGGFTGSAFGGASESVFGAQAASHLTKLTVILTTSFFLLTLSLAIIAGKRGDPASMVESQEIKEVKTDLEKPDKAVKKAPKADSETKEDGKKTFLHTDDKAKKVNAEVTPDDFDAKGLKDKTANSAKSVKPKPTSAEKAPK